MASSNTESLTELERRAESIRAELAQTVDALHSRLSPTELKADVQSYMRENPLQAAALAVGIAYPLWRLIGSMPVPVLLIGAGLAMSRRNESTGHARQTASHGGMMAGLKEKASGLGSAMAEKAQDTVENLRSLASDTAAQASEHLSGNYHRSRDKAAETTQQVVGEVSETYLHARDSMADLIERHPMLAGGVAFGLGSLVASAVPVTRPESHLMGGTAEQIRRRAKGMARHGLSEAQRAAQQVYQTAAEEIRNEGLTPEAARHAARTAIETGRQAMEQVVLSTPDAGGRTSTHPMN